MLKIRELETQIQFLEEANDHLNTLESVLLEQQTSDRIPSQHINLACQATHKIRCGAQKTGFHVISNFARRLEDSFKIVETSHHSLEIDTDLHNLLVSGVDWLRQIVELHSLGYTVDEQWLRTFCYPVFEELHQILGISDAPKSLSVVAPIETLQNITVLIFQTEVEEYLQHLESLLADSKQTGLKVEIVTITDQLTSLGELLCLKDFTHICKSIMQHLESTVSEEAVTKITQMALSLWRRSQALVLRNQPDSDGKPIYSR